MAVAGLERVLDDLCGVLGRHLEDAEAELGDFRIAAQRNARHLVGLGGHNRALPAWRLGKRFAAQPRSQPTGQSCGTLLTVNATVHERRSPVSRRASERRSRSRAPFFALGFLVILAAAAAGAAYVYDHGRSDRIAPGVKIGGVDVGGLTTQAARERLIQRAVAPRRRTLSVHAHGHTFTLPAATSKITADLDPALDRALAESRQGWIGARVMDGLTNKQRRREPVAAGSTTRPASSPH